MFTVIIHARRFFNALRCLCFKDKNELAKMVETIKSNFVERYAEERRHWGGGVMGNKSQVMMEKRAKALAREEAKRMV